MYARIMVLIFFAIFFLIIDYYLFQAVVHVTRNLSPGWRQFWRWLHWVPTFFSLLALAWWAFGNQYMLGGQVRAWIITGLVGIYFSKIFGILFVFIDDLQRGVRFVAQWFTKSGATSLPGEAISRSEFLTKAAVVTTAIPFGTMAYGIATGAHDYRVRRVRVPIAHLPNAFHGLRAVQISDIHSGSFWSKTAVKGGVEMILNEKPDILFFTGDLVNNETTEVRDYIPVFAKLKAPLGVFSVMGNHDYGDYRAWDTKEAKQQNFKDLIEAHRVLGFDLLMNEHRMLEIGGEKLAIIGNENWGAGRFSKYGKLAAAYEGTNDAATKILLSHDPSHWDAQVRPQFSDIDLTLAGHTHGFQFGVEIGGFKWSPSQYAYKQWAGLYTEGNQHLYVNRGFGYIGYPGRVGMPPEITVLELVKA
jgi:predicted MPP superfamily phosphohydrolase